VRKLAIMVIFAHRCLPSFVKIVVGKFFCLTDLLIVTALLAQYLVS